MVVLRSEPVCSGRARSDDDVVSRRGTVVDVVVRASRVALSTGGSVPAHIRHTTVMKSSSL